MGRRRSRIKTLKINDMDVSGTEDETVLDLARENDISIPTLCQLDGLSLWGGCRMCLIEVEGWNKLVPACTTNIEEGMQVYTDTPRLKEYRKMTIELVFAEGDHICAVCVVNGHCELQSMAADLGVDHVRFPYLEPQYEVDLTHKQFGMDLSRCIKCTRCVRVCDEIEGAHTLDFVGRGHNSHLISDLDQPWGESSTCTSCGKCVAVCPVGALFEKGKGVGEWESTTDFLPYLQRMRGNGNE